MKKVILTAAAIALTAGMFVTDASAGTRSGGIDQREHKQVQRIIAGIKDGSLNAREARQLFKGQMRIRVNEARAKADGHLTLRERIKLHRQLDRQSRKIWKKRHN